MSEQAERALTMRFYADWLVEVWFLGAWLSLCLLLTGAAYGAQATNSGSIPIIDAELGSCSVQFTAKDGAGKPVSGARLRVRIAYGFMGMRKLDLEVPTNAEGKARFVGMPGNLKKALFFRASKDKLTGTAFYDAARNCAAEHTIVMVPTKEEPESVSSEESTEP